MITRVQFQYINDGLIQHLQKHGSKYLGAGAIGGLGVAAHALSGESGEEIRDHAQSAKEAHEKLQHTMKGIQTIQKDEKVDPAVKTQHIAALGKQAKKHYEDREEAKEKLASHPAMKKVGAGTVGAGELGLAALAKRAREKKQSD